MACVLVHNFAIQVTVINDPRLRGQPLIIGGSPFQAKLVYDASSEAVACKVKPGMPLRQAYVLCPEARFLPSDEKRYEEAFEQVVTTLEGLSPIVEVEELGCAYLDANGVDSEYDLAYEIRDSIFSQTKLNACLAISSNKFLSRTAAFVAKPEAPLIVPEGKEKEFITPFSIDFLLCSHETKKHLHLLGIHIMAQLSHFPREALQAQFGSDGTIAYGLARGIDDTPLIPRKKPQLISCAAEFDPPLVTSHEMAQACRVILDRLLAQIKAKGKACHEIKLEVRFPSSSLYERKLPLKEATSSEAVIMVRLVPWLKGVSLSEPVSELELSLNLEPERGRKVALWPERGGMKWELIRLAGELRRRLGYQPLKKVVVTDPQPLLPEERFRLIDLD